MSDDVIREVSHLINASTPPSPLHYEEGERGEPLPSTARVPRTTHVPRTVMARLAACVLVVKGYDAHTAYCGARHSPDQPLHHYLRRLKSGELVFRCMVGSGVYAEPLRIALENSTSEEFLKMLEETFKKEWEGVGAYFRPRVTFDYKAGTVTRARWCGGLEWVTVDIRTGEVRTNEAHRPRGERWGAMRTFVAWAADPVCYIDRIERAKWGPDPCRKL